MDILSFVLGIAVVVVIVLSIVAVIAFVKARSIETKLTNLEAGVFRTIEIETTENHQRIDELEREIFSQLDSRLDRLENKLSITKK